MRTENRFYSDGTEDYIRKVSEAADPAAFLLCLRVEKTWAGNIRKASVVLCSDNGSAPVQLRKIPMRLMEDYTTEDFVRFGGIAEISETSRYYFELITEQRKKYRYPEHTTIRFCPDFKVPEWSRGMVCYQIYVDRFRNGNPANDVTEHEYAYLEGYSHRVEDWYRDPAEWDVGDFYGGDLQGVMHKLDYLQDLGIEVIYFNPLFVSPSNHKYDTQDYDHIDPHISVMVRDGGEELTEECMDNARATRYRIRTTDPENLAAADEYFAELVREAHRRGIRVILDGVFNHCGSFHKWLNRENIYEPDQGAFGSEQSEFREFFRFEDPKGWPANDSYEGWWDHETLPKLNYDESEKLCDEIIRIGKKWISEPYCADGWRLDVAADLGHTPEFNHRFWKRFRKEMKEVNPEVLILAENYGNSEEWLAGDEWDTIMNYEAFMEPVSWFLTGMEKHSEDRKEELQGDTEVFRKTMEENMEHFLTPSLQCAMNQLSNHDHSRFLTRTNGKTGRASYLGCHAAGEGIDRNLFMEAVVIQMTWPGAPTLYYGDEAGLCGFTDPDNRRTYPWGREDKMLLSFHREAIRIHRENPVLRSGSHMIFPSVSEVLVYGRFSDGEEPVVTAVNCGKNRQKIRIPVWKLGSGRNGSWKEELRTGAENWRVTGNIYRAEDGILEIELPEETSVIIVKQKNTCY